MSTTQEDLAFVAHMDAQFGEEQADEQERERYEAWASDRREDGEDWDLESYLAYLEAGLPDD